MPLMCYDVGHGDAIFTVSFTFIATAEVVQLLGATPVFVDIEPGTLNIDTNRIEEKITPQTRAIIPVHFAGHACDMDAIEEIARKHNLVVINHFIGRHRSYQWQDTSGSRCCY